MAIKYRYLILDGSLTHVGIPASDLTDEDFAALTPEQRKTVAASNLYEEVITEEARAKTAAKTAAREDDDNE